MKRRTILREFGTAAVITGGLVSTASARSGPVPDVDGPLDVSDVSGTVPLVDLLEDEELASLDVDPQKVRFHIDSGLNTLEMEDCCKRYRCCSDLEDCLCRCCTCWGCVP